MKKMELFILLLNVRNTVDSLQCIVGKYICGIIIPNSKNYSVLSVTSNIERNFYKSNVTINLLFNL